MTELILGIGSLLQGIYYQAKAEACSGEKGIEENHFEELEARNMTEAYFRDGVTRVALSIPLAVVTAAASIPDFIRFCTRTLTTVLRFLRVKVIVIKECTTTVRAEEPLGRLEAMLVWA